MTTNLLAVSMLVLVALGGSSFARAGPAFAGSEEVAGGTIRISGVYPHLSVFSSSGEVGIGAVAPWAGRLWFITYPSSAPRGSTDKLYEVDANLNLRIRPESVGGTHACRMIHRESNQLIIGPYFIDERGNVRAADLKKLVGRLTAVMRHLTDPANKVYFFDMEGKIYEVDVHSLAATMLFGKPVPGAHGKGGYTAQGRVVIANNGEGAVGSASKLKFEVQDVPEHPENAGTLAEWDGKEWRIVERRQFCDVTGPGGILGSPDDKSPLWAIGWDKRSVLLKLLDGGKWHTFRLPKASHCNDPRHGWYTEWPRIREVGGGKAVMDMHGMFYDFPLGFRAGQTSGISPIASHLRYIPDFCEWNGRLILASDEVTILSNKLAGQSISNLWFGKLSDLPTFGPRSGWGGPWRQDAVKAGEPSTPFLIGGFDKRVVHLSHDADSTVTFALEIDPAGDGEWKPYQSVAVPAKGFQFHVFPKDLAANWIRLKTDKDCVATAYFHYASPRDVSQDGDAMLASLAKVADPGPVSAGLLRQAKHNRNLQFLAQTADKGVAAEAGYYEVDALMSVQKPKEDLGEEVRKIAEIKADFETDAASVIMVHGGKRYRLPKGDAGYDKPFAFGWPRGIRECESERYMMNIHGTFYEMPRDNGLPLIKPVCSHGRQIMDYCTWRGLLVLSGTLVAAKPDGHYFRSADGKVGLWFGQIDDLWKLGKPVGKGGPWRDTAVKAGEPSDPYLMTGFDAKRIELSHDAAQDVELTIEVDIDHGQWRPYKTIAVPAGKAVSHSFPDGFNAHWVRVKVNRDCRATAILTYE